MEDLYIERWKQLLAHQPLPWVLFAHGTCVVLSQPGANLAQQAVTLIEHWPVHAGSELGDFDVRSLVDVPGWVITCAHPDILTYLAPEEVSGEEVSGEEVSGEEVSGEEPSALAIGLQGRSKRDQDAHEQRVIFVKKSH